MNAAADAGTLIRAADFRIQGLIRPRNREASVS